MMNEYQNSSMESLRCFIGTTSLKNDTANIKSDIAIEILKDSWSKFKTEHKTFKYLKEKNLYIEPISVVVGQRILACRKNNQRARWSPVKLKVYVVPIDQLLKKYLELPNVFSTILGTLEKSQNNFPIISLLQTESWQRIKSQSPDAIIIPLSLYFDDYETDNPLGSHRVLKKMGGTYFTISCLPPEFASKLENWFRAQIHKEQDYKRLDNKAIFARLK